MPDSHRLHHRTLVLVLGLFVVAWIASWALLRRAVPPSYVARGVVEIGYFNPRDYLPHPVISTQGLTVLVNDPSFSDRVASLVEGAMPGSPACRAAPLEEGLLRVEARSIDAAVAHRGAVVACSLLVVQGNDAFGGERELAQRQIEMIRMRSLEAESLVRSGSASHDARAAALRALAHFTEIQVETETSAELMLQKKPTRIMVEPTRVVPERPSMALVAMGPGAVVAVAGAAVAMRRRRRESSA